MFKHINMKNLLIAFMALLLISSCKREEGLIAVDSVTISPAAVSAAVDGTVKLTASVTPNNASDKSLTWTSSDNNIAVAAADGTVTGKSIGTVTITATSVSDPTKTATCEVTITDILATGIVIAPNPASVLEGKTLQLTVAMVPSNAANQEVTWSSSDPDKAAVDPNTGMVTGVAKGTVTITAVSKDGSNLTGAVTLAVVPQARTIAINPPAPLVRIGAAAMALTAAVSPSDAMQAVTWSCSDPSKAAIDASGLVTPIAPGTTTITAVAADGSGAAGIATLIVMGSNDVAIALGDENFLMPVPAAGGTVTIANAPRTIASAIAAVKVTLAAEPRSVIKIGSANFTQGQTVNFTAPVTFTVTAQDGTVASYTLGIAAYDAVSNPYGIYTVAHLNDVRNNKAGSYKMMNNITLPARDAAGAAAIGISDYADKGWLPIAHDASVNFGAVPPAVTNGFTGTFDGGNFSIDNFYIRRNAAADNYIGLFGITSNASISNTGIRGSVSPSVTGGRFVGALAGLVVQGSVSRCYADAAVRCESRDDNVRACAGGLLGTLTSASLSASYSSGDVSGDLPGIGTFLCIGGLAGSLESRDNCNKCSTDNCFAAGNIAAQASGVIYGGSLAGWCTPSEVVNCYASGNVVCEEALGYNIGEFGFITFARTYINCYSNSSAALTGNGQPVVPSDASVITPKTKAEMQDDAFKNLLNSGTSVWGRSNGKNDGLPYIIGVGVGK